MEGQGRRGLGEVRVGERKWDRKRGNSAEELNSPNVDPCSTHPQADRR